LVQEKCREKRAVTGDDNTNNNSDNNNEQIANTMYTIC
jgi:hypothetical protein